MLNQAEGDQKERNIKKNNMSCLPSSVNSNNMSNISLISNDKSDLSIWDTSHMNHVSTTALERLLIINDKIRSRIDNILKDIDIATKKDLIDECNKYKEEYRSYRIISSKVEQALSKAQLAVNLTEYLKQVESSQLTMQAKWRKLRKQNVIMKQQLRDLEAAIFEKKSNLVMVDEERRHWRFMCSVTRSSPITNLPIFGSVNTVVNNSASSVSSVFPLDLSEDLSVWNRAFYIDITTEDGLINKDIIEFSNNVISLLKDHKTKEASVLVTEWSVENNANIKLATCYKANMLVLVALFQMYQGSLLDSVNLIQIALNLRTRLHGNDHKIIAAYNNIMGFLYWKLNHNKNAAQYTYRALRITEKRMKSTEHTSKLAKHYINTGFMLQRYGFPQEGIRLMELGAIIFNSLLPTEERLWVKVMVGLARACNDIGANDDAMDVAIQITNYFHGKSNDIVSFPEPTIIDIAIQQQTDYESTVIPSTRLSAQCYVPHNVQLPDAVKLTKGEEAILREAAIAFITKSQLIAANVLDKWVEKCRAHSNLIETQTEIQGVNSTLSRIKDMMTNKTSIEPNFSVSSNLNTSSIHHHPTIENNSTGDTLDGISLQDFIVVQEDQIVPVNMTKSTHKSSRKKLVANKDRESDTDTDTQSSITTRLTQFILQPWKRSSK